MKRNCHNFQKNISALIDKQLNNRERLETLAHLKSCKHCAELYERMNGLQKKLHTDMVRLEVPWHDVQPILNRIKRSQQKRPGLLERLINSLFIKKWTLALEFSLLFCIAVYAGIKLYPVLFSDDTPALTENIQPAAVPRVLQSNIDDFLETSTTVLLQIKNGSPEAPLEQEKKVAADLFLKSKLVSRTFSSEEYPRFNELVNELEPVFLDIAHLNKPSLQLIQKTIDEQNLLLKLQFAKSMNPEINFK